MRSGYLIAAGAILPIFATLSATPARADTFGCTVLLCVQNPQGWASVPYCVPPVQKAFALVASRRPWPQCPEAKMSAPPDAAGESTDVLGPDGKMRDPLGKPAAP